MRKESDAVRRQRWSRDHLLDHLLAGHEVPWHKEFPTASHRRLSRLHRWVHEVDDAIVEIEKAYALRETYGG